GAGQPGGRDRRGDRRLRRGARAAERRDRRAGRVGRDARGRADPLPARARARQRRRAQTAGGSPPRAVAHNASRFALCAGCALRIVTWNVLDGGAGRLDAIEDVLRGVDADLIALQEANDRVGVERLAAALGTELVYGEANSPFAVAWLSRLPVTRSENHR